MEKNDPLRQLWLGAVLLTRLPLPTLPPEAFTQGARAVWSYPVVGAGIGAAGAVTGLCALWLALPPFGAAALALVVMMLLTGAMHEDGLADVFDGFWGGFAPARRLEIMRDSQIGTYGVLALVVVFALRLSAVALLLEYAPLALIAAAALSRSGMPVLMATLPHARADGLSHSVGAPTVQATLLACAIGGCFAVICLGAAAIPASLVTVGVCTGIRMLAKAKIGGQTGDVLGAAQQLSEAAILLTCVSLL